MGIFAKTCYELPMGAYSRIRKDVRSVETVISFYCMTKGFLKTSGIDTRVRLEMRQMRQYKKGCLIQFAPAFLCSNSLKVISSE